MKPMPRRPQRPFGIAGGVARIALFRAEGMAGFAGTTQGFLNSFAPMLALWLVGCALIALHGEVRLALESLGSTVVALLAQPVVSHWFAVHWRREENWLRYATAVNWCQWAPLLAIVVVLPVAVMLAAGLGLPPRGAALVMIAALFAYVLSLSWFLARVGLGVSRRQAVVLVVAINLAMGIVTEVPDLISRLV